MLQLVARVDRWLTPTLAPWRWIGELGVVLLGIHLAADRLDDPLLALLIAARLPWPDPETPLAVATWCAIAVELAVSAWAGALLVRAPAEPVTTARAWVGRLSVRNALAPALVASTGLAGAWVVEMAVEDLIAPVLADAAAPVAWLAAALVAWRFAWPVTERALRRLPAAERRVTGIGWAPLVLAITWLAARHGLPIWGWR